MPSTISTSLVDSIEQDNTELTQPTAEEGKAVTEGRSRPGCHQADHEVTVAARVEELAVVVLAAMAKEQANIDWIRDFLWRHICIHPRLATCKSRGSETLGSL